MLGYIRRNADSTPVKIILGVLSLTFVLFFGSSTLFEERTEVVAEVNGEVIRDTEIIQLVRRQVQFQRQFSPNGQEPDVERVRQQVIDSVIDQRLMLQDARSQGFVVSDKELRRAILENPSFQDDKGKFDAELYKKVAGRPGSNFERDLRNQLLIENLRDFIRRSVKVSDAEVKTAFEEEASKRAVSFVRVPTSLFSEDVQLTDEEVAAYATEHEAEITDRFDRDFETKYNQPKKVQASHILMKFDEDDGDEDKAAVRSKMEQVLAEVKAGADFGDLARKYSEDGSAPRGGDLGLFDEKRMVKPFSDAAFSMQPGETSELVESRFGLHIIKVFEVQEAETKTLDDVKADIARALLAEERAPELAKAYARTLLPALNGTLSDEEATALLAEKSLTIQESGEFSRKDRRVPKLGSSADALNAAFELTSVGAVTAEPVDVGTGFALLRLESKSEADMTAFGEKKEELRAQQLRTKQVRAVQAWQDQLKVGAKIKIRVGV